MSCSIDPIQKPDPASPAALWENARGCWEAFALLFGTPLQLLGEVFIRRADRNQANAFLRSLEALVRRLLLTEAVAVIPGEGAQRCRPGTQSSKQLDPLGSGSSLRSGRNDEKGDRDQNELDTESTSRWPAHFALRLNTLLGASLAVPRATQPRRHRPSPPARPHDLSDPLPIFDFAAPIALRIEALRRVIKRPAPYIQRTARALAAFRRRNRPPKLAPVPHINGDDQRFFATPLSRITATCADALDPLWPDTS